VFFIFTYPSLKKAAKILGMTEQIRQSLNEFFAWVQPVDLWLFKNINQAWTADWSNYFFPAVTDLHKQALFFYITPILVLLILAKKYRAHSFTIVVMLGLCLGWSDYAGGRVKRAIQRPRPFQTLQVTSAIQRSPAGHNNSFYSNHSSTNFAMAAFMSFFMPVISLVFYAIAFVIGYSRIYNGVHYPSDVIIGAFMGLIWGKSFAHLASRFLTSELRNRIWKDNYEKSNSKKSPKSKDEKHINPKIFRS
jgi:undecaprenyl-diphosphatase